MRSLEYYFVISDCGVNKNIFSVFNVINIKSFIQVIVGNININRNGGVGREFGSRLPQA